jgi:valyl-tRNA synthetase
MPDLSKPYEPSLVEEKWYTFWVEKGLFKADSKSSKEPYTIVLPPPNVTGALHMGHALVDTLEDILIRWMRMRGKEALWLPGTDHAGIATQSVVERHLFQKTGKRRSDFAREEFLEHVWEWKEEHQEKILGQLKKLGSSLDWSRYRFTMDEQSTKAVKTMFKKMFTEGLIYRGDYLVNWDPVLQTAIADDEVEYEEKSSFLWHIRYPIEHSTDSIIVATTRPETMLGDMAVAVAPNDPRFKKFVGKKVHLPLTNRSIPILEDPFVDKEFGTGAVKVTPAHDPNDYEIGKRHNLEMINILNKDASINENGGKFAGLSVEDGREAVLKELKQLGLLVKAEPHQLRVSLSYRSKAIIQPYLSKQWFINMAPFKEKLIAAVRDKKVELCPEGWDKTYYHWIENLRDWCISRQLWWGHRIPVWYHKEDPERVICHIEDGLPKEVLENPESWRQEDDVLDTWFSSALWPLTTLGWPDKTADFTKFYPNATLITGHDILFFWVARMIMMGEYATGEVPFKRTFIHGLIYGKSYWREQKDGSVAYVSPKERLSYEMGEVPPSDVKFKWEKMSKSKGNVIDPIEIIQLYGADAMRFALTSSVTKARQIDLDRRRFEEYKNFANKIWNAARFIFTNLESLTIEELHQGINRSLLTLDDRWILSKLSTVIVETNRHLESYTFDEASKGLYNFFWDTFCAYYLETSKPYLFARVGTPEERVNKQKVLLVIFTAAIRLMHPIAPFLTEELFFLLKDLFPKLDGKRCSDPYINDLLKTLASPSIMVAPYPEIEQLVKKDISLQTEEDFNFIHEIVYAVRNIRAEMGIPPGSTTDLHIVSTKNENVKLIEQNQEIIRSLVKVGAIPFHDSPPPAKAASTAVVRGILLLIPLPKELQEKEKLRLEKELEKTRLQFTSLKTRLSDESFLSKAPGELIEKTRAQLNDHLIKEKELESKLSQL